MEHYPELPCISLPNYSGSDQGRANEELVAAAAFLSQQPARSVSASEGNAHGSGEAGTPVRDFREREAAQARSVPELPPATVIGESTQLGSAPMVWVAQGCVQDIAGSVGLARWRAYVCGLSVVLLSVAFLLLAGPILGSDIWPGGVFLIGVTLLVLPMLLDDPLIPPVCFKLTTTGLEVKTFHGMWWCGRRTQWWCTADIQQVAVYKQTELYRYTALLNTVSNQTSADRSAPVAIRHPIQVMGELPGAMLSLGKCTGTLKFATCVFLGTRLASQSEVFPLSRKIWHQAQVADLFDLAHAMSRWLHNGQQIQVGRSPTSGTTMIGNQNGDFPLHLSDRLRYN
mmetsp:Transcript_16928/g.31609  ORF Transcript_16928/g.31609 Transcript_16928/m.31609 type:complete len:342 (-) Transcript_16928:58-1083(-)